MPLKRFLPLAAILVLLSVLWQVPGVFRQAGMYDEGLILVGADRILNGEMPYRDFWNTHPPGQISVVALLFRLFGPSIMIERLYDILVRAGIAFAAFLLARRMGSRAGALVVWAAVTVYLGQFPNYGYATFPALLCALAAFLPLLAGHDGLRPTRGARRRNLALAGVGVGCSILFRHDLGLGAVCAGLAVLWVEGARGRVGAGPLTARVRKSRDETLWYLAGASAVILPVAWLIFAAGTPWGRLKEIFFDFPFRVYPQVRALPFPAPLLERLTAALPAAVVLAGLLRALAATGRGDEDRRRLAPMLALGLLGVLAFPQAYTRFGQPQQIPVVVPALTILPGLLVPPAGSGIRRRVPLLLCGAAVLFLTLRGPWANQVYNLGSLPVRRALAMTHGLARARWVPLEHSQVEAVKSVQGSSRPGDPLFVGLGRHDKVLSNDALFYFLAGRRCATYYHNLLPGLVTTASVQREMLEELRRERPQLLVLYTGSDAEQEPNRSRFSSGVTLLDEGIRRDYARSRVVGIYEIWERKKNRPADGETGYNPAL